MTPGGKLTETKQNKGITESTNCILPPPQGMGEKYHCLKVGLSQILKCTWHWLWDGIPAWRRSDGHAVIGYTVALDLLLPSCTLPAALGPVGEEGATGELSCPESGIWNGPQVSSGARAKDPFRQNCDKVSWFSQLLRSAEFWDSQHEFLGSSGSE